MTVSPGAVTLVAGETYKIEPKITPDNATDKGVVYKTGDSAVATVSPTGQVKAVGEGSCTITVTTTDLLADKNYEATLAVTVKANLVSRIEVWCTASSILMGSTTTLTAKVFGSDGVEGSATNSGVTWAIEPAIGIGIITSQNNASCTIKGENPGMLTVICKAKDSSGVQAPLSSLTVRLT